MGRGDLHALPGHPTPPHVSVASTSLASTSCARPKEHVASTSCLARSKERGWRNANIPTAPHVSITQQITVYTCLCVYIYIRVCVCVNVYIYMLSTRGHFLRIIFGLSSRSLTWIPAGCHGGKSGDEVVFNKGAQQVGAQRSFWREMCPLIGIYISTTSHYEDCHFGMDAHKPQSMFWP